MSEFKRARSHAQKQQRIREIKDAVDALFQEKPYHEITLTMIAERLGLTRANLYSYFSTKEEIFLELCADRRDAYYAALISAFPKGCGYSLDVTAEVWSGILNGHRDYLQYSDILHTIVETNVTVERLAAYKKRFYEKTYEVSSWLGEPLGLSRADAYELFINVHYHAVGIYGIIRWNPLVTAALEREHIQAPITDFRENLRRFIQMNLAYYIENPSLPRK